MIKKKQGNDASHPAHGESREKEQKQISRERIIAITIDCVFASLLVAAVRYHHPGNEINTCSYPLPFHFIHRTNERTKKKCALWSGITAKNVADAHWEWLCCARIRIYVYDLHRCTQHPAATSMAGNSKREPRIIRSNRLPRRSSKVVQEPKAKWNTKPPFRCLKPSHSKHDKSSCSEAKLSQPTTTKKKCQKNCISRTYTRSKEERQPAEQKKNMWPKSESGRRGEWRNKI